MKSLLMLVAIVMIYQSCSWQKRSIDAPEEFLNTVPNQWFSHNPDHSLINTKGFPSPHLYFDTMTEFSLNKTEINVIVATPEGSDHAYAIDLNSGQRHYSHSLCKQRDVWNKYKEEIFRPPFSVGYIPKVLDQLGDPQKVIIWSSRKNIHHQLSTHFFKVKLVGAYVEQACPYGNCLGKNNWLSRLVFIAIDPEDPVLSGISTIADFKKVIDWEKSKAHLENIDGRNFIGDMTFPATRLGALIEFSEAFEYAKKRSIFLTNTELKKVQKGCHLLYDRLWEEVGKTRPEDKAASTMAEMDAKRKLKTELEKKKFPVGFGARFKAFSKKYFTEVSTCEKFVYHGNVNRDQEAFWFLSYVGLFYRLNRDGYFFDCRNKTWQKNILNDIGRPIYNLVRDIEFCGERELDQAMNYLPNFLNGLKGEKEFYKFVDYDNHPFGTHEKMYSWVKIKARRFDCKEDPNINIRKEIKVFPEEVNWNKREVQDIADKLKIIY